MSKKQRKHAAVTSNSARAKEIDQAFAEALHRAMELHVSGQLDEADKIYQSLLDQQPEHADALHLSGAIQHARGNLAEAERLIRRAIDANRHPTFLNSLAVVLTAQHRLRDAEEAALSACQIDPDYLDALNTLGVTQLEQMRFSDAEKSFRQVLTRQPEHHVAYCNLGNVLSGLGQTDAAEQCYRRSLDICPSDPKTHINLHMLLMRQGRLDEANRELAFVSSSNSPAELSATLVARASALMSAGSYRESAECLRQALVIQPSNADAHYLLGISLLREGCFSEGWHEYEWRFSPDRRSYQRILIPDYGKPMWAGESLPGKVIVVQPEQGLGDQIQFARYAQQLKSMGATVWLRTTPALAPLLSTIEGVDRVLSADIGPDEVFDYWAFYLSLPHRFATMLATLPADVPYVVSNPGKVEIWRKWLDEQASGKGNLPRIGLVWAGRSTHDNDWNRSIPLDQFDSLADVPAQFVSLQIGDRARDIKNSTSRLELIDASPLINDFADAAALIENLDLLITVDSAPAHLAGALGRPVWTLIPYVPDWRWMIGRTDSPWYPTMRLFRQQSLGDWQGAILAVGAALCELYAPEVLSATPLDESMRRKRVIVEQRTDVLRWSDREQLEPAWNARAKLVSQFIPAGARVFDIGCGAMALEGFLPKTCSYVPCDVVARDARTIVCDLNAEPLPAAAAECDRITMLGVLEYLYEPAKFLQQLREIGKPAILSYCPVDWTGHLDRRALGWVNDLSLNELDCTFQSAGLFCRRADRIDQNQALFLVEPGTPPRERAKKVLVLSCANVGNFGDRLGYHLIHSVLPADAEVTHAFMSPWHVPDGDYDLLVLGIGNSLFAPLLTDELIRLIDRIPHRIGIFGTQYRSQIPVDRLRLVIGRLDHWFARYEEDSLLYGKGSQRTTHLGDWLIDAFPLARWTDDETLSIGDEVLGDRPMDRTIQTIQRYRRVHSARLHPLLCALTSAEQVSFSEQRETGSETSGKFRSLLLDVFGKELPDNTFWDVDHDAVVAYKSRVSSNIAALRLTLHDLLTGGD
ncbi:MAG: hypothetical protein H6R17_2661 [Proteobacteria bacterium]|nr:hypothetical protein [Pseudomonadota bacterium]